MNDAAIQPPIRPTSAVPPIRRLGAALILASIPTVGAGGTEIIANCAEPPAREVWDLRESWRQGADDEGDLLLGQVAVAISGPDGEVFALDSQLARVLVFDAAGRHLRTLGREGDGPGEFRQPTGLGLTGDGSLAVMQTFPGRLVYLDPATGEPRGQWILGQDDPQAGGFALLFAYRERGGVTAVAADRSTFDPAAGTMLSTRYLALLDDQGKERRRLAEMQASHGAAHQVRDDLADHFPGERGLWALGPDGRLYLAPRYDEYRIDVYGPDGSLERSITRDHAARLRTEQEKAEERRSLETNVGGREMRIDWKQQDRARCIARLQVLDDGALWVVNSHGDARWPDHGERVFDVYDAAGSLEREVTVRVPGGGEGNRLLVLDDGRFLLIRGLEHLSLTIGASDEGTTAAINQGASAEILHELVGLERAP